MQINIIRDKKEDITRNTKEIQRIIRKYFEDLYSNRLEKLREIAKFMDHMTCQN
jgi:RNA-binding protein YlmH